MSWARRLRRVFDAGLSTCPRRGAPVRVPAVITNALGGPARSRRSSRHRSHLQPEQNSRAFANHPLPAWRLRCYRLRRGDWWFDFPVRATIGASSTGEAIYRQLLLELLETLGLGMGDIDRYAPELQNSELMQYAGSGDVAHKNYRMIAAMAVMSGAIERKEMKAFVERIGMSGYVPPQGHVPSGVAYLGHAVSAMAWGEIRRVMVVCKASQFLNRLTALYDGMSFLVEGRESG
jgi:hypothetical protein